MAATPEISNALMTIQGGTGSGDSGFSNSGQIDWVTLAGSSVKFTIDVLARLSKAGVEAFTLAASYALFGQFQISHQSELRIQESVEKLRAYSSFNNALFFGFGVKHIVRSLADSSEGLSVLAICAILSEFYGTEHAATILREIFKLANPPVQLTPALRQWANLVKVCEGALVHTNFSLHLSHIFWLYSKTHSPPRQYHRGNLSQTANAINELFKVAQGRTTEATFLGGPDCVLIAAIASWLLDLNVEVKSKYSGILLYKFASGTKGDLGNGYTITVLFKDKDDRQSVDPPIITQISRYQHIIEVQQLFKPRSKASSFQGLITTRVPWSKALSIIFGDSINMILSGEPSEYTGGCLGTIAFLSSFDSADYDFELMAEDVEKERYWRNISSSDHGRGLLEILERYLPELQETAFFRAAKETHKDLVREHLAICTKQGHYSGFGAEGEPECFIFAVQKWGSVRTNLAHSVSESELVGIYLKSICFFYHLSRFLSAVQLNDSILPSRNGLIRLYQDGFRNTGFLRDWMLPQHFRIEGGNNELSEQWAPKPYEPFSQGEISISSPIYMLLSIKLFAIPPSIFAELIFLDQIPGSIYQQDSKRVSLASAKSRDGICLVQAALIQPTDKVTEVEKLYIFPGSIIYEDQNFDQIVDDQSVSMKSIRDIRILKALNQMPESTGPLRKHLVETFPVHDWTNLSGKTKHENSPDQNGFVQLFISDTCEESDSQSYNSTLWAHYRLYQGSNNEVALIFHPMMFTKMILAHTVPCWSYLHFTYHSTSFSPPPPMFRKLELSDLYSEIVVTKDQHSEQKRSYPLVLQGTDILVRTAALTIGHLKFRNRGNAIRVDPGDFHLSVLPLLIESNCAHQVGNLLDYLTSTTGDSVCLPLGVLMSVS